MIIETVLMLTFFLIMILLPLLNMAFNSEVYKNVHNIRVDQIEGTEAIFDNFTDAVEYKGTWNANTNTPTLADGTGGTGDMYVVSVGGTQDLGSGNLTFTTGDRVIYNGTIWQKMDSSVTASEVPITDSGTYYTAEDVEAAFQENRPLINANTNAIAAATTDTGVGAGNAGKLVELDGNGKIDGRDVGADGADIDLNTTHRSSDGTDHANVVLNDTHRGSDGTDHANVVLNDTHRGGDGSDHADVATNTVHSTGDGSDHADVATNTAAIAAATTDTGVGAGNAGKLVELDGNGKIDGRDVGADGATLDALDDESTDDFMPVDFTAGASKAGAPASGSWIESGAWAMTWTNSLPGLERTPANNTTEYYDIPLQLPAKTTASKGTKITGITAAYSIDASDAGDDVQFQLLKRTVPNNGSAPGAKSVVVGDADGDYDGDHDTAAKRVLDTGGPQNHTLVVTDSAPAYIGTKEVYYLRIKVIEANDATGALAFILKDLLVHFSRKLA